MKRISLVISTLFLAVAAFASGGDTLRVLAIGNSFSQDAVEQNLHEIADCDGRVFIIGNMYIGGCTLERHYRNSCSGSTDYEYRKVGIDGKRVNTKGVTLDKALADEPWDVVTLQQASGRSGLPTSYEPYLRELILYVKARTKDDVKLCWHQTWAYDPNAVHGDFPNYGCDCEAMYKGILESSKAACERYGLTVIPSGTAVQNVRPSYEYTITRDGFHLSTGMGRYLAALTWYEALTGRSVEGCTYCPAGVDEKRAKVAQKAAHLAVQKPFERQPIFSDHVTTYDESEVPSYELPDALRMADGRRVKNVKQWEAERRPELLNLFAEQEYGKAPGKPENLNFDLVECGEAFGGKAIRKQVRVRYGERRNDYLTLLIYAPKAAEGPVPAFLGINFEGNIAVADDPDILMPDGNKISAYGVYHFADRGAQASRWCVEQIIDAGYAVATFDRADVDPDYDDNFGNGVQSMYLKNGEVPAPDEWGTIAAWAWGLSRALDYLEVEPLVDEKRVAVIGHSRLGKTALWAGAVDIRFAMVISNDSGCGGAAISRRCFGETVEVINRAFPHWFCDNFLKYSGNEGNMPFDQHELLALIAPRPLYVASASEDLWADPKGEGLALEEAQKVYLLWGRKAIEKTGRHIRPGSHDITSYDWTRYIQFADKWLK